MLKRSDSPTEYVLPLRVYKDSAPQHTETGTAADIQYLNECVEEESCDLGWVFSGLSEEYVMVTTVTHDTQFSENLINSDHQWLMEG